MRKLLAPIVMPVLKSISKTYVAGETLDDALSVARDIGANGHGVTLCYWHGEDETAESVETRYAETVRRCIDAGMDFHLSVKIPAFGGDLHRACAIVDKVRAQGGHVDFDSHAPEQADDIYRVAEMLGGGEYLGCAIPGRWRRSVRDAERAVSLGLRVRVVKGSWEDPGAPDIDLREGYLAVIDVLAGKARQVGVATHDDWLIREAMDRLQIANTEVEQELLYGLPMEAASKVGEQARLPLRVYVPYGAAWLPYSVTRALTNPRTIKWLASDLFSRRSFRVPGPRRL
jgi:proline dehydrogenase